MSYRTSSQYHKIRHLAIKQKDNYNASNNFFITITKEAAFKFEGCVLQEHLFENGIVLVKSGGDINKI